MRLEWTDPALDALEIIRDHIAKDLPFYARRFIERIFDAAGKLRDHPRIGRLVPEGSSDKSHPWLYQSTLRRKRGLRLATKSIA